MWTTFTLSICRCYISRFYKTNRKKKKQNALLSFISLVLLALMRCLHIIVSCAKAYKIVKTLYNNQRKFYCPVRYFIHTIHFKIEDNCRRFSFRHILMQIVLNFEILNYENHIFEYNNSPNAENIEFH